MGLESGRVTNKGIAMLFSLLVAASGSALANGDAAAGKSKAAVCAACHGLLGVSINDEWPNLASQKYAYLVKQLKAFRDGTRKDPLMTPMAEPLSDRDIDNLAAYFSTQTGAPSGK
jgi:cytochrome c553